MTAHDGAVRFDRYMADALYGDEGFYATGGVAGRRGDFITSPEVGPLFGAVLAAMLDDEWNQLGRPDDFTVIEAGAGPGTLARSVVAAQPECLGGRPERYVAVEISTAQRALHPANVTSLAEMPRDPVVGVIVANELLDNLPFRLAVYDGRWCEAWVVPDQVGAAELLRPIPELPAWLPSKATHGSRAPVQDDAAAWVSQALQLLQRGRLLVIDYAVARTAELASRPWREWLRTYRRHERGEHYLRAVGQQDITSDVCLDQIIAVAGEPDAIRSQAQFLRRWGIDELVEEGRRVWAENAARPDLASMRARSRVREAEALLDPGGLGNFLAVEWTR